MQKEGYQDDQGGKPEYMLVGVDNKVTWDDAGQLRLLPPGKDTVTIVDIGTDPASPKIVGSLPLMNSIFGPPTNLAITPNGQLGLVANSMDWAADGAAWKSVPDNKLYVIDLTSSPPRLIDTVTVGKQPSGMSINRAGNLALVTNRADNSISVLSIDGKQVKVIDTVVIGPTGAGAHALEEWVELKSVAQLTEILAAAAKEFCA